MDLADISHFFAENMMLFTMEVQIWNISWGDPDGPEGRSGERREERSDERRPERSPSGPTGSPHVIFQIWTSITKNIMLLSKKMWDTQPNPRYSAKNNDAIRMISSFMPNHNLNTIFTIKSTISTKIIKKWSIKWKYSL